MLTMNAYEPVASLPMGSIGDSPAQLSTVISPVGSDQSPVDYGAQPIVRYVAR